MFEKILESERGKREIKEKVNLVNFQRAPNCMRVADFTKEA